MRYWILAAALALSGCSKKSDYLYVWNGHVEEPPTPVAAPTCRVTTANEVVAFGSEVTFAIESTGATTELIVGGQTVTAPRAEVKLTPASAGVFSVAGKATGPGGVGTCEVAVRVEAAPTCALTASPATSMLGDAVTFALHAEGTTTTAAIEGVAVEIPDGKVTLRPPTFGAFVAHATVVGPGGTGTCVANYVVKAPPPSCTLTADPASILLGARVKLAIRPQGFVTSTTIEGTTASELWVTPADSGHFTAHGAVTGPGGTATCEASYDVKDLPPTCEIATTPTLIYPGQTLTARVAGHGKITTTFIDEKPGAEQKFTATTGGTFTLHGRVVGPGGTGLCETSYTVKEWAPTCTLTASPATITLGDVTTLELQTDGKVTEAKIEGTVVGFPTGKLAIRPSVFGEFVAHATVVGPGGSAGCEAKYVVKAPVPSCQLKADPASVILGGAVKLTLVPQGFVTATSIEGTPGAEKTITPPAAGHFIAHGSVTGPGGTANCEAPYEVKYPAPTCEISATPAVVFPGQDVTARLVGHGEITASFIDDKPATQTVFAAASGGTYEVRGRVVGPGGEGTCRASYVVNELPPSCGLTAAPTTVLLGDPLKLELSTNGLVTSADIDGTPVPVAGGTLTLRPLILGTFYAHGTVKGPGGQGTCLTMYTVKAPPPTCSLAADPQSLTLGGSLTLRLTAQGYAASAMIDGTAVQVPTGTLVVTPPAAGTITAHGKVVGPGGEATCDATYEVRPPAPSCDVVVVPNAVFPGQTVIATLRTHGVATMAAINGTPVTAPQGQLPIAAGAPGLYGVHGTVSGPGGSATCDATYTVKDIAPTCELSATPNPSVVGGVVTLALQTFGKVTAAAIAGQPVAFPTGTLAVTTTSAGTFSATAQVTGPGGTASCNVSYVVTDPPPTCTVSANPSQITLGQMLILTMTSSGTVSSATLDGQAIGFPVGTRPVTPTSGGIVKAIGRVRGPGGEYTCETSYIVQSAAPTCTLTATPATVKVGATVTLALHAQGEALSADIDGNAVAIPDGSRVVTTTAAGMFVATGKVRGQNGTSICQASYVVEKPPGIPHEFNQIVKDTVAPKGIDMLWIIDNSGSMMEYQKAVADNTDAFISKFTAQQGISWKIGLISTDDREEPYVGFTPETLLTFQTPSPVAIFQAAVKKLGIAGSGTEKTFGPTQIAIDKHPDFVRKDTILAMIMVTDAPEQSGGVSGDDMLKYLLGKVNGVKENVAAYGIFGAKDLGCPVTDDEWNYAGSEYEKLVTAVGGKTYPLCQPGFGEVLADIGKTLVAHSIFTKQFPLPAKPIIDTIEVKFHGKKLPSGPKSSGGYWIYDAATNNIIFNDLDFATGAKEEVTVTFLEPT